LFRFYYSWWWCFEIVAQQVLTQYKKQIKDRARLGVQAFAELLLIIPKAITQNAEHNQQETIVTFQQDYAISNYQLVSILQQVNSFLNNKDKY
jgi:chaperonin GroEL (HSP60 family)